jgi:hypothetical protein
VKIIIYKLTTKVEISGMLKTNRSKGHLKLFLLVALLICYNLQAQETDLETRIKEQFDKNGQRKIIKAEKLYLLAADFKQQAEKLSSSSERKALKKSILASRSNGKANRIRYKILIKDLKKYTHIDSHDSSKIIKKKIKRAKKIMRHTNSKREAALKLTNDNNAYSLLKHSDELELKAMGDLNYVYGLLLRISRKGNEVLVSGQSTDDAIKADNFPIQNPITNTGNEQEKTKDKEIGITDLNQGISGQTNTNHAKNQSIVKQEITDPVKNIVPVHPETEQVAGVYFKIQIGASKTPYTVDQLERNFKTNESLGIEIDGEWTKYFIQKKFGAYEEALSFKENLKIRGSFIVAYKNGKKVSIDEALKKESPQTAIEELRQVDETIKSKPDEIVYRLQIGFSTKRMSETELASFMHAGQEILTTDCGTWFIYTVGQFSTEAAALQFKKQKGLTDAELVKFINGKPSDN